VEQLELLRYGIEVLERLGVRYALVGSYGTLAYGEARFTQDIDIVVDLSDEKVREFCAAFPAPEWYVSEAAAREAVRRRRPFNVIHTTSGGKLDIMIPGRDEWGCTQLDRRRAVRLLPDRDVFAAHPEDVIIGKLRYFHEGGSDKHLRDVAGILQVSGELVDRASVRRWAEKLGVTEAWDAVLSRVDQAADAQR
jgi:hypothetical protein